MDLKMADSPLLGTYQHYKGNSYEVLEIATHTETVEKLVVYRALYAPFDVWVRPYAMFFETIIVDGHEVPRFKKLSSPS